MNWFYAFNPLVNRFNIGPSDPDRTSKRTSQLFAHFCPEDFRTQLAFAHVAKQLFFNLRFGRCRIRPWRFSNTCTHIFHSRLWISTTSICDMIGHWASQQCPIMSSPVTQKRRFLLTFRLVANAASAFFLSTTRPFHSTLTGIL